MKRTLFISLAVVALFLTLCVQGALAAAGPELVSATPAGLEGNSGSGRSSISADGRYVAFESVSTNLVSPPTPSTWQIFVRDRFAGATTVASVSTGGAYGDSSSLFPSVSGTGRYVAFESTSTNLVSPPTSGDNQVYIRDTLAGTTILASVSTSGAQGNGRSHYPGISADGRYVAFQSLATDLVSPGTTGDQVFVRDLQTGTTTLVSVTAGGTPGNDNCDAPAISPDGRYVTFASFATNLVVPATSGWQIFVHDRQTGANWLASKGPSGDQGNNSSYSPRISADGRYIAFNSDATNLVSPDTSVMQTFVYDRMSDTVSLASVSTGGDQGDNRVLNPSGISADGRYVTFSSFAHNLVSPPTTLVQVFLRDRQAGATTLVSANASGDQGNDSSSWPSISADGKYFSFESGSTNFVSTPITDFQMWVAGGPYIPPPPDTFTITATAGANGSISPSGAVTVNNGASQTFTITAGTGYDIADVLIDGASVGAVSTYTFTNVTANHTISASFAESATGIGTGTGTGSGSSGIVSAPIAPSGPVNLANPQVVSATISASRVGPGEAIRVTASVLNKGTGNGTVAVKLYVNGQEEASQGVTVNSGASTPVTFTVSRSEPGTYSVYVGGMSAGSFTVENDSSNILYISIAMVVIAIAMGLVYFTRRKRTV